MGVIWSDEGIGQQLVLWQPLAGSAMVSEHLTIPLAGLTPEGLRAVAREASAALLGRLGRTGSSPLLTLRPDDPGCATLALDVASGRLGLAHPDAPVPTSIEWLASDADDAALGAAWGRRLSIPGAWRLLMIAADAHPGTPMLEVFAPSLGALAIGLDATARQALSDAAAVGNDKGALAVIQRALALDDPALVELAGSEDLVLAGLLSAAPGHGGYRTWAGPLVRDLEDGALLGLAYAERTALATMIPPMGEIEHRITPEAALFAATGWGLTPAEAVRCLQQRFQARIEPALAAMAALREDLGKEFDLKLRALDELEIRRGSATTTMNLDAVLDKLDDVIDGPGLRAVARGLERALAEEAGPYGMIDPAQACFTLHLRPAGAREGAALADATVDDMGTPFALVACVEDDNAVLPIRDAAGFGGLPALRTRLANDRDRLCLNAEAMVVTGALSEDVALAVIGSNVATALVRPPLSAALHELAARSLPGEGALLALAPACGLIIIFRLEHGEAALGAIDGLLAQLGSRAGAPLGFFRTLAPGPTRGAGRLVVGVPA